MMNDAQILAILHNLPSPFNEMAKEAFNAHKWPKRSRVEAWMNDITYAILEIDIVYTPQGCVFWGYVMDGEYDKATAHLAQKNKVTPAT